LALYLLFVLKVIPVEQHKFELPLRIFNHWIHSNNLRTLLA
jgi:hypothetical protein